MKRITSIVPLFAIFATILIWGATVGAATLDSQSSDSPRGVRRMLQTLDAPNIAKLQVASAAIRSSVTRFD